MSVFGREPPEKESQPLPFLSLRHAQPKPRQRPAALFAPEGDEPGSSCQQRRGEPKVKASSKPVKRVALFQDEDDEEPHTVQRASTSTASHTRCLFQDESDEESASSSSSNIREEQGSVPKDASESVFALGWSAMTSFQNAHFWERKVEGPPKKKRAYNNEKRREEAAYSRNSKGVFTRSGSDMERVSTLIQQESCLCTLYYYCDRMVVFCLFTLWVCDCSTMFNPISLSSLDSRRQQGVLQAVCSIQRSTCFCFKVLGPFKARSRFTGSLSNKHCSVVFILYHGLVDDSM